MGRGLAIVAVLAGGWTLAVVLFLWSLRLAGLMSNGSVMSGILLVAGLAVTPAAPAAASWLAGQGGWTVAAWILGVQAAILAVILGGWLIGMITQS
ncbi:hypothetical protein ACQPZX_32520 [Actinoplanes sp. CA-142083]|uniref:hypothetical protein n=1 Tax=Actinoplanes sp. CA-142083 TaxID=3239903 RepID=UPI003D91B1C7